VRQIQNYGLSKAREQISNFSDVFDYFEGAFDKWGRLKREDKLIEDFGGEKFSNHILFLLTLAEPFERKKEDEEFYSLWLTDDGSFSLARRIVDLLEKFFEKEKSLLSFEELFDISQKKIPAVPQTLNENSFLSFLEVTKKIEQGPTGQFGLSYWPEVRPRGTKDRAYLVLKKMETPLHFQEITRLINEFFLEKRVTSQRKALPPTVHNELIKDSRFVLVGRGLYALKEWGFEEGTVKEIISKVLKEKKKPLDKREILEEVQKQRLVKDNTIFLGLRDKNYFQKNPEGKYTLIK